MPCSLGVLVGTSIMCLAVTCIPSRGVTIETIEMTVLFVIFVIHVRGRETK